MRIAVIPGDGIGKEVTAEAVKVLERRRGGLRQTGSISRPALERRSLPVDRRHDAAERLRDAARRLRGDAARRARRSARARQPASRDILLGTRFELDLYVNYRPVRLLDDRLCPLKDRGREGRELRRVSREHRRACTSASAAGSRPARRTRSRFRKRSTPSRASTASSAHAFEFARDARPDARCAWRTRATR